MILCQRRAKPRSTMYVTEMIDVMTRAMINNSSIENYFQESQGAGPPGPKFNFPKLCPRDAIGLIPGAAGRRLGRLIVIKGESDLPGVGADHAAHVARPGRVRRR